MARSNEMDKLRSSRLLLGSAGFGGSSGCWTALQSRSFSSSLQTHSDISTAAF